MSGATRHSGIRLLHVHHHAPELGLLPEVTGPSRVELQLLHSDTVDCGAGVDRTLDPAQIPLYFPARGEVEWELVFRSGWSLRARKSSLRCGHSRAQCVSSPQIKHP